MHNCLLLHKLNSLHEPWHIATSIWFLHPPLQCILKKTYKENNVLPKYSIERSDYGMITSTNLKCLVKAWYIIRTHPRRTTDIEIWLKPMHLTAYAVTYNDSITSQQKPYEKLFTQRYYEILPSLVTPKILSMAAGPEELGSNSLWLSPIT